MERRNTRAQVACNHCRFLRTRCDETKPTCSSCKKHGKTCDYPLKREASEFGSSRPNDTRTMRRFSALAANFTKLAERRFADLIAEVEPRLKHLEEESKRQTLLFRELDLKRPVYELITPRTQDSMTQEEARRMGPHRADLTTSSASSKMSMMANDRLFESASPLGITFIHRLAGEWLYDHGYQMTDFPTFLEQSREQLGTNTEGRYATCQSHIADLEWSPVDELTDVYMARINIMHPILTRKIINRYTNRFSNSLAHDLDIIMSTDDTNHSVDDEHRMWNHDPLKRWKHLPRTLSHGKISWQGSPSPRSSHRDMPVESSVVLLIMALGKFCEPRDAHAALSMNVSRKQTLSNENETVLHTEEDMLTIPGFQYFSRALGLIDPQADVYSLEYVHLNILSGLYLAQLGRVWESYTYIHKACCAVQRVLLSELSRLAVFQSRMEQVPVQDNPLVFAFWACLQLECDVVADLNFPRSGILDYEAQMPLPNLDAARNVDGFSAEVVHYYAAQVHLRRHLNETYGQSSPLNNMLTSNWQHNLDLIKVTQANLDGLLGIIPSWMKWEGDTPAHDILAASFRAKFYRTKATAYRSLILEVLEMSSLCASESVDATANLEKDYPGLFECLGNGIDSLLKSTTAFHGVFETHAEKSVITDLWGVAHMQWGNILTLIAAYNLPILRAYIDESNLRYIYTKAVEFLGNVADTSPTLQIDYGILRHIGTTSGIDQNSLPSF